MNVLILNWRDIKHPLAGGAEISLEKHAQYWIKKGARVTWFSSSFPNAKQNETINGISYIRRGNHFTVATQFFFYYFTVGIKDIDVVIDCFHFFPFFTPLFVKNKTIVALINEVAGEIWYENIMFPIAFIGSKLEPYIIRIYNKKTFLTASNSTVKDLISVGIKRRNIIVVQHGYTKLKLSGVLPSKEKNPTLLFLGRLSKDKGIEDALLMLEILIRDNKDVKLWIVGKAESENYERKLYSIIDQNKLKDSCKFYGFVSEEKKAELLARSWILIHPSIKEGWGLNVIEANSVGTPAVGYRVPGLVDSIVDNKTGLLVENDPESLASAVEDLIKSKSELSKLSKNAINWSKQFTWEKAGRQSWSMLKNGHA